MQGEAGRGLGVGVEAVIQRVVDVGRVDPVAGSDLLVGANVVVDVVDVAGPQEEVAGDLLVVLVVDPEVVELHVERGVLRRTRPEPVGRLRRPVEAVVGLEPPAVLEGGHVELGAREDLTLARAGRARDDRRDARRFREPSIEGHVSRDAHGDAARRAVPDDRCSGDHALRVVRRRRRRLVAPPTDDVDQVLGRLRQIGVRTRSRIRRQGNRGRLRQRRDRLLRAERRDDTEQKQHERRESHPGRGAAATIFRWHAQVTSNVGGEGGCRRPAATPPSLTWSRPAPSRSSR